MMRETDEKGYGVYEIYRDIEEEEEEEKEEEEGNRKKRLTSELKVFHGTVRAVWLLPRITYFFHCILLLFLS